MKKINTNTKMKKSVVLPFTSLGLDPTKTGRTSDGRINTSNNNNDGDGTALRTALFNETFPSCCYNNSNKNGTKDGDSKFKPVTSETTISTSSTIAGSSYNNKLLGINKQMQQQTQQKKQISPVIGTSKTKKNQRHKNTNKNKNKNKKDIHAVDAKATVTTTATATTTVEGQITVVVGSTPSINQDTFGGDEEAPAITTTASVMGIHTKNSYAFLDDDNNTCQ